MMNTRTLRQPVPFKASPRQVYETLMDSKKHTSLSGEKAKISRKAGGRFTAWNGHITGFNLVVKPGEKIVQAWRATGWWPDHYSVVVCNLKKAQQRTKLEFTQMGIPPHRYSGHYRGWIEAHWTPMKEILEDGKISEKTRARVKTSKTERIARQHFRRKLSKRA
jgi:activator of HSP90 ATPase